VFNISNILEIAPYSLLEKDKERLLFDAMIDLTKWHYGKCSEYKKIIDVLGINLESLRELGDIPFIPVRLFKDYDLLSVDKSEVIKTMTSSGTTSQRVSKIYLDKVTSTNQTKTLVKIVSSFTGKKRLPMLVIDSSVVVKNRNLFSARGAGILGFSMLGYDITYIMDEQMNIDFEQIRIFLEKHKNESILIFGFTFMIWEYFYKALLNAKIRFQIDEGILIHGGGWKKLAMLEIDNDSFKKAIFYVCGIRRIHNYYGMVEQTGSIFMECEKGFLHTSIFSDIIIRDPKNFNILGIGEKGLIQLISLLPISYPGHSILSEDLGELSGIDDCDCGRKGKYFAILGRIQNAEVRGCSDTYTTV
jgi:phenylacetate-coenzyme A ligase PaaK-like adenylate-forming protein